MSNQEPLPNPLSHPLDYFYQNWAQELVVIIGAPMSVGVLVLLACIVTWMVFRFLHKRELDQIPVLTNRLIAKDEDIARLKEQVKSLEEKRRHESQGEGARRRSLSPQQQNVIAAALREQEEFPRIPVYFSASDGEAEEYARQFWGVLKTGKFFKAPSPTNHIPSSLEGLVIWVRNQEEPPLHALQLSKALTQAGIVHRIESLPGATNVPIDYVDLIIGRKNESV